MTDKSHVRHRRGGSRRPDFSHRLTTVLNALLGRTSRRHGDSRREHRRQHATRSHERRPWFVRREVSLLGLTVIVGASCALLWLGWCIVGGTAAQRLALSSPETALQWNAGQAEALDKLALAELAAPDGDLKQAQEWAKRALRARPIDNEALLVLALVAKKQRDEPKAEILTKIAGARTWRNQAVQLLLYDSDIRRGDFSDALLRADAMLRAETASRARVFPALAAFTTNARTLKTLTDFLATDPPWRTWFLGELSNRLVNKAPLDRVYASLMASRNPPTQEELQPYLSQLIKARRYRHAYDVWYETLPPARRPQGQYPYNRDFAFPITGLPFDWLLKSVPGADIQIATLQDGKQRALRVQFSGARVYFTNVRQLMLLPAGQYSFSGSVKAEDLDTSRGLWWHIFCADAPNTTLAHTELTSHSTAWTDFAVDFIVPAGGCNAQWLQLELPSRISSEQRIGGQIWYQRLRIGAKPGNASG